MGEPIETEKTKEMQPFEAAVLKAIRSFNSVAIYDKVDVNGQVTEDELLHSRARLKAFEDLTKKSGPENTSEVYDKIEALAAQYRKSPKVIKDAKDGFAKLQAKLKEDHPDLDIPRDSIDLNSVAGKELESLSKNFSAEMEKLNQEIKRETFGSPLNPSATLSKIVDKVVDFTK